MPDLPNPKTAGAVRQNAIAKLRSVSETPELDTDLMLSHVTGLSRASLLVDPSRELGSDQHKAFERALGRRLQGEPVAYIIGTRGFRRIEVMVDERVLTPRPETERLVEIALSGLERRSGPRRVIDVGTGSGAIALAIADELGSNRPDVEIIATDVSDQALEVAQENRRRLGFEDRVRMVQADLLDGLDGPFDVVLANLPYLRPDQQHPSIKHEPRIALYSGSDGFEHYRRLLAQAKDRLATGGLLAFEIDPSLTKRSLDTVMQVFGVAPRIEADLAGMDRTVVLDLGDVDSD